jgi:hypothetical protein
MRLRSTACTLWKSWLRQRYVFWHFVPGRIIVWGTKLGFGAFSCTVFGAAAVAVYDRVKNVAKAGTLKRFEWVPVSDGQFVARPYLGPARDQPPSGIVTNADADSVFSYTTHAYTYFREVSAEDFQWDRRYATQAPLGLVLTASKHCPYCASLLIVGQTADLRVPDDRSRMWRYETSECAACHWWCVNYRRLNKEIYDDYVEFLTAYAVLRRFDPLAVTTPLDLARDYLRRNPHKLARFDPFRFEDLMTACLRDCYRDAEIVKLGGRNDRGIDIKAVRAGGQTTLIQVKRREDFSRREGVRTVRELHGVMLREGIPRGMVISSAPDFTPAARAEAAQAARTLEHYSMELLSLSDVVELLAIGDQPTEHDWLAAGIRLDQPEPPWGNEIDWVERRVLPASIEREVQPWLPV